MLHLSWQLARNVKITDRRLFEYIKHVLMHSLKQCQLAINYIENCGCELKHQARLADEPAHYCYDCDAEVFNILFISEQPLSNKNETTTAASSSTSSQTQHVVHCQACARKRNHLLDNFVILSQYELGELKSIYDQFQLYVANTNIQGILNNMNAPIGNSSKQSQPTPIISTMSQSQHVSLI
jgi:hypothetical protein